MATAAAALVLLVLAVLFIRQWVQIPYDYIPEKWSDFTFWTELWKEKTDSMEYLMKIEKSILQENCKMRIKILTVKNNKHIIIA